MPHDKLFLAFYFGLVPGTRISRPEPAVLASFGTQYNRTLVSGEKLPEVVHMIDETAAYMRSLNWPCHAFVIAWHPRETSALTDSTVFLPITPLKTCTQEERAAVRELAGKGLTFVLPEVYQMPIQTDGE